MRFYYEVFYEVLTLCKVTQGYYKISVNGLLKLQSPGYDKLAVN